MAKRRRHTGYNPAERKASIDFNPTPEELRLGLRRGRHFEFDRTIEVVSTHFGSGVVKDRKFASGTFKEQVGDQLFFVGVPTNSGKPHDSCSFAIRLNDDVKFTLR